MNDVPKNIANLCIDKIKSVIAIENDEQNADQLQKLLEIFYGVT